MNRLPTLLLRCLLWACLFVGSRSAEGSFPKSSPPCPVTVTLPDPVAFTHDARGNLLNDGQPLLAYDAEDQLTSIRVPPTATAAGWETQFVYDGLGRLRIRREITVPATGSTTTRTTNQVRYLYDGFTAVQERDGNNAVLATYTRGNDLSGSPQGAGGIGGLLARTDASGSLFYHADGGGNVTTLFNASQAVVGRYSYDPFGNLLGMSGAGAAGNRYRFSSKEVHPQTGMYYYGFRFYEPNLQRWTSRDPIEEMGGLNLYGFVGNDPVDGVDPFGWSDFNRPPMVIIGPNGPAVYGPPMPDPMIGGSSGPGNPIGDGLSYYSGKLGDGYNGANNWVKNSGNPIIGKAWNMMHIPLITGRPFIQAARALAPCKAGEKVLVIGENMERVGPFAKGIGAEIYPGMPGYKAGMEAQALAHNQAFVQQKMSEGYKIIDIGPDFVRRAVRGGAQPAYEMERTITKGYQGYEKAFIRTSKESLILLPQ